MSAPWTFQQISGRGERKTLTLSGYNAPFGRPRKDPVIVEVIKSRIQTQRYPGGNGQTRNAFGVNHEPTELHGRWMTKMQPGKLAGDIAQEWIDFVRDERTCRISWGFFESWTGYISELHLSRESPDEIAWKMVVQLDSRDDVKPPKLGNLDTVSRSLSPDIAAIGTWAALAKLPPPDILPDMSLSFVDILDQVSGLINTPAALLNKIAGEFDDLEKGTFSALQNAKSAIDSTRTATLTMEDTLANAEIDSVMLVRSGNSDASWAKWQLSMDREIATVLAAMADADRKLDLATQSKSVPRAITAWAGDTWESLSIRATNSTEKAGSIRDLSGARYGEIPIPGQQYLVL